MAEPFAITTTTTAVPLDGKRQGSVSFTVSNTSGRALRARARIVPANAAAAPWLTLDGPPEHPLPAAGTEQWTVLIAAPPAAPQGTYTFRLDVVGVDNPDEELSTGPSVTFAVPAPVVPPKPFPWWIIVVAAVVLLAAIGASIIFVVRNNSQQAAATQTAVAGATATVQAAAAARFDGAWVLASGGLTLAHNGAQVSGPYQDSADGAQGTLNGTVTGSTLNGQWSAGGRNGNVAMTLDAAGQVLAGTHPLCGARPGIPLPAGCSFAGDWTISLSGPRCPMTAQVVNQQIQVSFPGGCQIITPFGLAPIGGAFAGGLSFPGAGAILAAGVLGVSGGALQFQGTLRPDGTQFQGNYAGNIFVPGSPFGVFPVRGSWCGGRSGQAPPC